MRMSIILMAADPENSPIAASLHSSPIVNSHPLVKPSDKRPVQKFPVSPLALPSVRLYKAKFAIDWERLRGALI